MTDFVDSHERIDYMLIQLRRLCMDTGPMYDCMFYPTNQSDDNRMLCVHNETKTKKEMHKNELNGSVAAIAALMPCKTVLPISLQRQQQCVYFIEII